MCVTAHSSSWLSFYHCHLQKVFFFFFFWHLTWKYHEVRLRYHGDGVWPGCDDKFVERRRVLAVCHCETEAARILTWSRTDCTVLTGRLLSSSFESAFVCFCPFFVSLKHYCLYTWKGRTLFKACYTFIALLERKKKTPRICHNKVQINITCTTYLIIFFTT